MAPTAGTRLRFQKANQQKKTHKSKKVPSLKNRIRALERFLQRSNNLTDDVKASKKTELQQLRAEQKAKEDAEVEKQNAVKSKKPRFFERIKLTRKLRQANKHLEEASTDEEKAKHQETIANTRQNLMYIYYFPKAEPYLPLFPPKPHHADAQKHQDELKAQAIERFTNEEPGDAFEQFCVIDKKESAPSLSAAELLLKSFKTDKRSSKPKKSKSKSKDKVDSTVLVDKDQVDAGDEEQDDFFL